MTSIPTEPQQARQILLQYRSQPEEPQHPRQILLGMAMYADEEPVDPGPQLPPTGLQSLPTAGGVRYRSGTRRDRSNEKHWNAPRLVEPVRVDRWNDGENTDAGPRMTSELFRRIDDINEQPWDVFRTSDNFSNQSYSHPANKDRTRIFQWADFERWSDGFNLQRYSHPPPKDETKNLDWFSVELFKPRTPWFPRPEPEPTEPQPIPPGDYIAPRFDTADFDHQPGYETPPWIFEERWTNRGKWRTANKIIIDFGPRPPAQQEEPWPDKPIEASRPEDNAYVIPWGQFYHADESRRVNWGNGRWERPLPDSESGGGWNTEPDSDAAIRPPQPNLKEVYIIMPSITLWRIPDGAEIQASNVRWYTDADTWAWSLTATISDPASLAIIKPDSNGPRELGCFINGHEFTALIESYTTERAFGQTTYTIQGRSRTAWLSDPYALERSKLITAPYSARQLAEKELENTGFTLDWLSPDWQVPGGAFSYRESDPIAVIKRIAEASGSILQSHPGQKKLIIKPRYPVDVHKWKDPTTQLNAILPEDMIIQSGSEYRSLPRYNKAIVTGGSVEGVIVAVTRDGTAGDILAPIQQHDLITDQAAGYERGRQEIAKGGVWESIRATTWLTPDNAPGLMLPSYLVEIQPADGQLYPVLISSTEIYAVSTETEISVRQILGMERKIDD